MWKVILAFSVLTTEVILAQEKQHAIVGNPLAFFRPCDDNANVTVIFESGLAPGEENRYLLRLAEGLVPNSKVELMFDGDATLSLKDADTARVSVLLTGKTFRIDFFKAAKVLFVDVKGPKFGAVPYVQSIKVNTAEYCGKPTTGYLDGYIQGYKGTAEISSSVPDDSCGRRKVQHTELIVNGLPSKPGDWPWHAAMYRLEKSRIDYICGGTLISKTFVLSAAHCVTLRGDTVLPETRNIILGKYNLVGGDTSPQEIQVHEIIVHENYNHTRLDNDIALLKLRVEVTYNDYIQPVCVWYSNAYKKLRPGTIYGTVAGWGFDHTDTLSSTLLQVTIPKVTETTCIKSDPNFFSRLLTDRKFCAGFRNGTSACNGDSGGGFHVFIPDETGNDSADATGAWYVRGIVSLTLSRRDAPICDSNQYVIFTDLAKYTGWLKSKTD